MNEIRHTDRLSTIMLFLFLFSNLTEDISTEKVEFSNMITVTFFILYSLGVTIEYIYSKIKDK